MDRPNAFARLAAQVMASMTASGDREVLQVAAELDSATSLLTGTAFGLVVPTVGMLAWVVFLRASGRRQTFLGGVLLLVLGALLPRLTPRA